MESGLYTIVEFDDNDKWFVMYEKEIDGIKYSYLIRVNQNEDEFIDEYQFVKSDYDGDEEYMEVVTGDELKRIAPLLVPETQELLKHPDELKKLLLK